MQKFRASGGRGLDPPDPRLSYLINYRTSPTTYLFHTLLLLPHPDWSPLLLKAARNAALSTVRRLDTTALQAATRQRAQCIYWNHSLGSGDKEILLRSKVYISQNVLHTASEVNRTILRYKARCNLNRSCLARAYMPCFQAQRTPHHTPPEH